MNSLVPLQTSTSGTSGATAATIAVVYAVLGVFFIVCFWRLFTKAGQPGWAAIIPIYNTYITLKIIGRPWWWLLLLLIPFVNIVLVIIIAVDLAKAFGKGAGFAIGLVLLAVIFVPILAFGSARYLGPPNRQGALPPGGYGSPPGGYGPPPGGYSPPPRGYTPPPGGWTPPGR